MGQVVVEVGTEQQQRDGVGVGDVDGLDVVVNAEYPESRHHAQGVVQALLGRRRLGVHVV